MNNPPLAFAGTNDGLRKGNPSYAKLHYRVSQRPTVATVIIGARNEEQLRQNLGAVGWTLTPAQIATLDAASARTPVYPYWHQRAFSRNPPPV